MKERVKRVLNFRRPSRAIVVAAVALAAVLSVGFAVNRAGEKPPDEPPDITVLSGGKEIEWAVGKNVWNNSVYDRIDNFQWLMNDKSINDLTYVKNEELIKIRFSGNAPGSAVLTEFILREDGSNKYNMGGMEYVGVYVTPSHFSLGPKTIAFTVKPDYRTLFSSFSGDYKAGNTVKGYRLVCSWGGNECEYAFIIRGDAAITRESASVP